MNKIERPSIKHWDLSSLCLAALNYYTSTTFQVKCIYLDFSTGMLLNQQLNDFFDNQVNNFEPCVIVLANIKRERNTKDCVQNIQKNWSTYTTELGMYHQIISGKDFISTLKWGLRVLFFFITWYMHYWEQYLSLQSKCFSIVFADWSCTVSIFLSLTETIKCCQARNVFSK